MIDRRRAVLPETSEADSARCADISAIELLISSGWDSDRRSSSIEELPAG